MAINWSKVQQGVDFASRAGSVKTAMDEAAALGSVRNESGNPDLDIPYTTAVQNLFAGRRDSLIQQAKDALAQA